MSSLFLLGRRLVGPSERSGKGSCLAPKASTIRLADVLYLLLPSLIARFADLEYFFVTQIDEALAWGSSYGALSRVYIFFYPFHDLSCILVNEKGVSTLVYRLLWRLPCASSVSCSDGCLHVDSNLQFSQLSKRDRKTSSPMQPSRFGNTLYTPFHRLSPRTRLSLGSRSYN